MISLRIKGEDEPNEQDGYGAIDIENQVFKERIGIIGSGFSLNYSSDRVAGRQIYRSLDIPLSGPTIPR